MADNSHSRSFIYYLFFTALTCGAMIMVIEVLGSKVIGPVFGVSLFVWTSLITVTLVALSAGYAAGGYISDKKDHPDYLYGIIFVAGLLVILIPFAKSIVLRSCQPLGLRMGALSSSTILFGPSLFLLGCVSPYIIKVSARELRNIGRTVGVFYSISTVGSFLGTILTGFFLIAYFGVSRIFEVAGILLVFLAVIYFVIFRKKLYVLAALIIPFLLFSTESLKSFTLSNGTKVTEVLRKDTFYGQLNVVDYMYGQKHYRELLIDGQVQGGIDMSSGLSIYPYSYFLQYLPYGINPEGEKCLVIGLGAGIIPMWYKKMGIETDVVDISPDIARIAGDYFGFKQPEKVVISDARYYLNTAKKVYDYVILDVFNGDTTPSHIISLESFQLLKSRMTENGILAINMAGSLKHETFITASIIKTLQREFRNVNIYPLFVHERGDGIGNLAIIASDLSNLPFNIELFLEAPIHPAVRSRMMQYLGKNFEFTPGVEAIVLSDEYNPTDYYDVWLKEKAREGITKNISYLEVLL